MTRRKTGLRGIKRREFIIRCFIAAVFFSILVIGAVFSPAARLMVNGKLMVDHKIVVPAGGILLSNGAMIGGGQ